MGGAGRRADAGIDIAGHLDARRADADFERTPSPAHIVEAHHALRMGVYAATDDEIRARYASGDASRLERALRVDIRSEAGFIQQLLDELAAIAKDDAHHPDRPLAGDATVRAEPIATTLEKIAAAFEGTGARRAALSTLVERADALNLRDVSPEGARGRGTGAGDCARCPDPSRRGWGSPCFDPQPS